MSRQQELISFIASMTGEGSLRVEENLGEGFVRLRVAEAERRQAKHDIQHVEDIVIEMLRNARDAHATKIYIATAKEEGVRTLLVLDNGNGIPEDMFERIFDARVTSKLDSLKMDRWGVHGRGMALYSIRENTQESSVVTSGVGLGSSFRVTVDCERLPERADQSTWPQAARDEQGSWTCVRGPHNIIRAACEFALEERHGCDVYLGSPAEIAATLYAHASSDLDASQLLFLDDERSLPVVERLGYAADASDIMRISDSLGISISERTAHRILSGQIKPVRSVSSRILRERTKPAAPAKVDLSRDRRGLKISHDDLDAFSRQLERDFDELASKYYLTLMKEPRIKVSRDSITVTFEVGKGD